MVGRIDDLDENQIKSMKLFFKLHSTSHFKNSISNSLYYTTCIDKI